MLIYLDLCADKIKLLKNENMKTQIFDFVCGFVDIMDVANIQ